MKSLTTSQRITAKSQLEKAGMALSGAVAAWRKEPTAENIMTMCERHDEYKAAYLAAYGEIRAGV